jgi:hypothetical protein
VSRRSGPASLAALAVLVALTASACGSSRPNPPAAPAQTTAPAHQHPAAAGQPAAAQEQTRVQFEQLMGQHALIAVRLMRTVEAGEGDLRGVSAAALQANGQALGDLVGTQFGSARRAGFDQVWKRHQDDLTRYGQAVAGGDEAARKAAAASLMAGCDAYATWLAGASQGRVSAASAKAVMHQHADELISQADAYGSGDYGTAYRIEREAYEHMFQLGTTVAKASLDAKDAARLDTPPEQLRSAFAMLLGEHMELITGAQRATFAKPAEFQAAGEQMNANTAALTKAMGAIVGPARAKEFQAGWSAHVDTLVAYGAAAARGDQAGKAAAERKLDTMAVALARYLNAIVKDRLKVGLLTGAITEHDRHLLEQVDAYAAKDYAKAYTMEEDGYQQMRAVADTLVDAIGHTVKPGLPVGGSQTGGGGTARRHP